MPKKIGGKTAVTKKAVTKKPVIKKFVPKKLISKTKTDKPDVLVVEEITLEKGQALPKSIASAKEVVVVHRCQNCEHLPVSAGKMVTLFSVLIFLLSFSILVQLGQINVTKALSQITQTVAAASLR